MFAERKPPVFEPQPAARPVVSHLHHLVLKIVLREVVARARQSHSIPAGSGRHSREARALGSTAAEIRSPADSQTEASEDSSSEKCASVRNDSLYGLSFNNVPIAVALPRFGS